MQTPKINDEIFQETCVRNYAVVNWEQVRHVSLGDRMEVTLRGGLFNSWDVRQSKVAPLAADIRQAAIYIAFVAFAKHNTVIA